MSDYVIGIPSYKRAEKQDTLSLLQGAFGKEDIILSTQCMADYLSYKERYNEQATIIFREGDCVGDNRNNILQYCQERGLLRCIMLDDDIRAFKCFTGEDIKDPLSIKGLFDKFIQTAEKANAKIFGAYPICSKIYLKPKIRRSIVIGTCFGVMDTSLRFNRDFKIKEDYELCLRVLSAGGTCIRFDGFSPLASHYTAGGCKEQWNKNDNSVYGKMLADAYPDFVTLNKKRGGGEVLFTRK